MDTRKEKGTLSVEIETAYSLVTNRNYSSEEIKEVLRNLRSVKRVDSQESKDEEQFLSFLVCPFCKLAKCEYVSDVKYPYFSIPETAMHKDGCFLKKEEYTQAELKSNLKRGNVAFIERAINEFVSVYRETEAKSRVSEFKRLPLKLATFPLRRSESGSLILYYGNVNVSVSRTEDERGRELVLSSPLTGRAMYQITITDNVYRYMPEDVKGKLKENTNTTRFVCFFGSFSAFSLQEKNRSNEACLHTSLLRSSFLKIL